MTLLDDARRLADGPKPTYWDSEPVGTINPRWNTPDVGPVLRCAHCRQKIHAHEPDCLWLSVPKIVKALELAEQYGITFEEQADGLHLISQRRRAS